MVAAPSNITLFDDSDGGILYLGSWSHTTVFDTSSGSTKTLSYSDQPGAELSFGFGPTGISTSSPIQLVVYGYMNDSLLSSTATYVTDSDDPVLFTPDSSMVGSTRFFVSKPLSASVPHMMRIFVTAANTSAPFIVDSFAIMDAGTLPPATPNSSALSTSDAPRPTASSPAGGGPHSQQGNASQTHIGLIVGAALGGVGLTLLCLVGMWLWRRKARGKGPILKKTRHVLPTAAMMDTGGSATSATGRYYSIDDQLPRPYTLKPPDALSIRYQGSLFSSSTFTPPSPAYAVGPDILPFATPAMGTTPMSSHDILPQPSSRTGNSSQRETWTSSDKVPFTRSDDGSALGSHPLRQSTQGESPLDQGDSGSQGDAASVASSRSTAPPAYASAE